mmetsp:Transcript_16786/g.34564  ORF Transcript_16786/g.34564 Transcript_16786/m.34564 type:complete len:216 (+) Transcript_16786:238-885(+)
MDALDLVCIGFAVRISHSRGCLCCFLLFYVFQVRFHSCGSCAHVQVSCILFFLVRGLLSFPDGTQLLYRLGTLLLDITRHGIILAELHNDLSNRTGNVDDGHAPHDFNHRGECVFFCSSVLGLLLGRLCVFVGVVLHIEGLMLCGNSFPKRPDGLRGNQDVCSSYGVQDFLSVTNLDELFSFFLPQGLGVFGVSLDVHTYSFAQRQSQPHNAAPF